MGYIFNMNLQKQKPYRSKQYLNYIRSLDCVATGMPAEVAHHVLGLKQSGMGTKIGDNYAIPLTVAAHQLLHQDPVKWEYSFGKQLDHLERVVYRARQDGQLTGLDAWSVGL